MSAAVAIAFVGPVVGRATRRSTRWAVDTARESSSPVVGFLGELLLGPADVHHHGDRSDVVDDLLRALIGATGRGG
jgi:hypothetical protein